MLTRNKILSHAILVLLLVSMFPLAIHFSSQNASATNPVLSAYGITPLNFDIGKEPGGQIFAWCTYTDADNDAPTTLNLNRFVNPTYLVIKAFTGNNSGDTTYSDGKLYYCTLNYYDFPYVGTSQIRITTTSNGSAIINKVAGLVTQIPVGIFFGNFGVSPANQTTPDNYTFFAKYFSSWGYSPDYVKVRLDGILYTMTANQSGDTNYLDGKNYSKTLYLSAGFHTYSFNTSIASFPSDRYVGDFYLLIQNENSSIGVSFGIIALIGMIAAAFLMLLWAAWR